LALNVKQQSLTRSLLFLFLQRAKKWAEGMDHMGNDRLRFANILMETLEDIEQQSGIFLIKPMYSFKGRLVLSYIFFTSSQLAKTNH
jgi:hypothetical protein